MQNPKRGIVRTQAEGHAESSDGSTNPGEQRAPVDAVPAGETPTGADNDGPVIAMENDNPLKRRAVQGRKVGVFVRAWRGMVSQVRQLTGQLTPEEQAIAAERKRRRQLKTVLEADAKTWETWMIGAFDRLGLMHEIKVDGKRIKTTHIKFDLITMEPDAISYHIDTVRLPKGVDVDVLKEERIANNLGMSAGRRITVKWTVENGIWYIVERASGRAGIKNHVQIKDMWDAFPESANSLTIPIGLTHNARPVWVAIDTMPHALIAGTTGSGKSNFEHVGINTLIRRNTPARCRLVLVDLKGGLEFNRYRGVPHLLRITADDIEDTKIPCDEDIAPTGIVTEREKVPALLGWLRRFGERRMQILGNANAANIGEYNAPRHGDKKMSFVVIWVDEWADVRLGKGGSDAESELINLVQRMRAVGMYFFLATQIPKSEVVSGLIKGNLPCHIAFSVPNIHASQTIIDVGDAAGLEPAGRCILQHGKQLEVQTPYINRETIQQTIDGAKTGQYGAAKGHDVTDEEIMRWALAENAGWLSWRVLWAKYEERGMQRNELINLTASWEGKTYLIDTTLYKVMPGVSNKGRRLVAVEGSAEPAPPAPPADPHKYAVGQRCMSASLGAAVTIQSQDGVSVMREPGKAPVDEPFYTVVDSEGQEHELSETDLYPGAMEVKA